MRGYVLIGGSDDLLVPDQSGKLVVVLMRHISVRVVGHNHPHDFGVLIDFLKKSGYRYNCWCKEWVKQTRDLEKEFEQLREFLEDAGIPYVVEHAKLKGLGKAFA